MFKIRYATIADAEVLADFSRQTFYDTFASYNTVANMEHFMQNQFTREMLIDEYRDPSSISIMAFNEHELCGYSTLKTGKQKEGLPSNNAVELARIYTLTNTIGMGVGSGLIKESINWATKTGHDVLWLGVWEKNQRAIDFYLKWGFEPFGAHTFMLGDDPQKDILMMKPLT